MKRLTPLHVALILLLAISTLAEDRDSDHPKHQNKRNVIIFVADGLRAGSVNATDAPTMLSLRSKGVFFQNSHSIFPTFTMPNGSAIATGHTQGDTGAVTNSIYVGFPI